MKVIIIIAILIIIHAFTSPTACANWCAIDDWLKLIITPAAVD